ncbi:protein spinster homolog 3-like isoform X6 [Vicugna pacos]|uniref:Protein spinster homolog 3-like isoform X6 n=1 Tax=Vicugna pacos TaxID=30538 RepID=A0ABM5D074_VICPA
MSWEESEHSLGSGSVNHQCSMNGDPGAGRGLHSLRASVGATGWRRGQTAPRHLPALGGQGHTEEGGGVFYLNRSSEVFISCLTLSAPLFGYLGDRHNRKAVLSFGILFWSGAGLSSSFIPPQYSWLFFLSRGLVGIGTASSSIIAPTILCDLFVRDQRTQVLTIFYIFIAVGSLILGALTVVTGIIGVILGAEASRRYKKVNPRAEPLICAVSLFAAAVSFYLAFVLAPATLQASYAFLALGELLLSCSCAVVADILLSVVVPRCWGTAGALQITVSHILGDAGSPYLTGLISSALRDEGPDSHLQHFLSLRRSFLCLVFVIILGGGCFWLTTLHLERDQALAQQPGPGTPDNKDMDGKATESQPLLPGTSASTKDH